MDNVVLIGLSPNRSNIFLSVVPSMTLEEFVASIASKIKSQNITYPKTLIFCHSYNVCNIMYDHLEKALGPFITNPPGYPVIRKYHIIDNSILEEVQMALKRQYYRSSSKWKYISV